MMTPWVYALVLLSQVDVLEQNAMEVLGLIRSVKNGFAPINRIPSEVFSLVPQYWDHDTMDENLITLTHVCRGWRELFIALPWLWARLDCTNVDKTRVYIGRAKSSRLEISLLKASRPTTNPTLSMLSFWQWRTLGVFSPSASLDPGISFKISQNT